MDTPFAKQAGRVAPTNHRKAFNRLEAAVFGAGKWPDNGLRHSFATHYLAHHQDTGKTALALGHTPPAIVFAHYREHVVPADAAQWWQMHPASTPNVIRLTGKRRAAT